MNKLANGLCIGAGYVGGPTMAMIAKISDTCKKPGDIKWNFTKFLVDREGNVVARFEPTHSMKDVEKQVAYLL